MPCNLYGPYDNFDLENSHFVPALIRKIINFKKKKINLLRFGALEILKEK